MKKLILVIAAVAINHTFAFSQGCLPEGITFYYQIQIDNFPINYPGCTQIEGSVHIDGSYFSNLNGLSVLTSIGGALSICDNFNLTSLTGLEGVTSIGGYLDISGNAALTSLTALENLTSFGGDLYIDNNTSLTSLTGLENLTSIGYFNISNNAALTSLTGLENLTSIGDLLISGNVALASLTGLENLTSFGGDLEISGNVALNNLTALENLTSIGVGGLFIDNNTSLTSLTGLENLTSIGVHLGISGNAALTNLTGLEGVTSIGGYLDISGNAALTSLTGLENLTSIGEFYIFGNPALTSLTGLENIDAGSISSITILNNTLLSTCEVKSICDYLAIPGGSVNIEGNAPGCNSPEEVEAACEEVSIENIAFEDDYLLFPNPAGKTVTISGNNATAIQEIFIYNLTGQKVQQGKPVNNTLDISKLQPGMYIIELLTDQGKVREKLVVQ